MHLGKLKGLNQIKEAVKITNLRFLCVKKIASLRPSESKYSKWAKYSEELRQDIMEGAKDEDFEVISLHFSTSTCTITN